MAAGSFWWWKYDDTRITDEALDEIAERIEPSDPAPWHPTDPISRYYGMVFYWFNRDDFDVRLPLSVVNSKFDKHDSLANLNFYIRWGGMHRGAFCIVVQEPRSIAKAIPKPLRPETWRYESVVGRKPFPDRTKMRWGYVNIAREQIFLHWWHRGHGKEGVAKIIRGFHFTGKYYLKDWPGKDPLYFHYQRILRELVRKEWDPVGSYFDLRKM